MAGCESKEELEGTELEELLTEEAREEEEELIPPEEDFPEEEALEELEAAVLEEEPFLEELEIPLEEELLPEEEEVLPEEEVLEELVPEELEIPLEEELVPEEEEEILPAVSVCQKFLPYLKRICRAALKNRRLRACLCYYVCRVGPKPRCTKSDILVVRRVLSILKACPQYRNWFCRCLRCISCKKYLPYLRNVCRAALKNRRLRACLCYYVCQVGPKPKCTRRDILVVRRVLNILRVCPQYKAWFCRCIRCK